MKKMKRGYLLAAIVLTLVTLCAAGMVFPLKSAQTFAQTGSVRTLHERTKIYSSEYSPDYYAGCEESFRYVADTPSITVFTHGLGGNASHWSNVGGGFAYHPASAISKIGELLHGDFDLYIASIQNGALNLEKVFTEENIGGTHYVTVQTQRISSAERHIVVLFESNHANGLNSTVYEEFDETLDHISLQYKSLCGKLPVYNLVGHSRGGLTNIEFATNHPYNVASVISLGTPYSGATLSSVDAIMEMLGYKKDGEWINVGAEDILNMEESIRLRDGWNAVKERYVDARLDAVAIGSVTTLEFLELFVEDLRLYGYIDDSTIEVIEGVIQVANLFPGFTNLILQILNGLCSVVNSFGYGNYEFLSESGVTFEETREILKLVEMINGEIVVMDDLFIDLNSQLANGYKFSDQVGYNGFARYLKAFGAEDYNGGRSVPSSPAVVHNLECMNGVYTEFIADTLTFGNRQNHILTLNDETEGTLIEANGNTLTFQPTYSGKRTFTAFGSGISVYEYQSVENGTMTKIAEGNTSVTFQAEAGKTYLFLVEFESTSQNYTFEFTDELVLGQNAIVLAGEEERVYYFEAPSEEYYTFTVVNSDAVTVDLENGQRPFAKLDDRTRKAIVLRNTSPDQITFSLQISVPETVDQNEAFTVTEISWAKKFINTQPTRFEYQMQTGASSLTILDFSGQIIGSYTVDGSTKTYYFALDVLEPCYLFFENVEEEIYSSITYSERQFRWKIDGEVTVRTDVVFRQNESHTVELVLDVVGEIIPVDTNLHIDGGLSHSFNQETNVIRITAEPFTDATLFLTPEAAWNFGLEIHLERKYYVSFYSDGRLIEQYVDYVGTTFTVPGVTKEHYDGVWKSNNPNITLQYHANYMLQTESDLTFHAQWTGKRYTITYNNLYNPYGQKAIVVSPTHYIYGEETVLGYAYFSYNHPNTESPWTFIRWYTSAALSTEISIITNTTYGDVSVYAWWTWTVCDVSGSFSNGEQLIDDSGYYQNWSIHTSTLIREYDFSTMVSMGYAHARIDFTFVYREEDDGYQHVRFINSAGELLHTPYEYDADGSEPDTITISFNVSIEWIAGQDEIIVQFDASGLGADDWYLQEYDLTVTYL